MTNASSIQLETDRLILRPTHAEDWPFARDFLMCEDTMRHLGGHHQESDAWRTLEQWIGRIGPWHPLHWPTREVGWGLRKAYWGKGYAFEAAAASLDYAFNELGWDSVTHLIADENVMSQKLAARLGSKPGEYVNLPGSLSDVRLCVWSQTREERKKRYWTLLPEP